MLQLRDFAIGPTLQEEDGLIVVRAEDQRDQRVVLLKIVSTEHAAPREIGRLQHDYEIACTLDLPTTIRVTECHLRDARPYLVMEDFGGVPLEQLLREPMSLDAFLPTAIRLADAVAQLHAHGVIHRELRPASVLVNPTTGQLKLGNFASATRTPSHHLDASEMVLEAEMLPYMAPEQTGRMNRAVDFRSDLYALGVMFYRMLAGCLPFEARDAMEWVHCHIARTPVPLVERSPGVPHAVADIVDRLLAKMADQRYQTAAGLRTDLETCWRQLGESGQIASFALGTADVSPRLVISQMLYGREHEVGVLVEAFERVVAAKTSELVLVAGYSGIGKSSLVQELYRPIIRQRSYFVTGKFDEYKRDVPYALLAQAFRGLVRQLLAESEVRVDAWRERIRAALGINAQLIAEIIPELEVLIGPQPPVPDLPIAEAQHRFFIVFEQFVAAFVAPERPLVLFLDDLQWVDAASLELLEHLLVAPRLRGFLLIGAYRDNEVGPAHPLMLMLENVRRAGIAPTRLDLAPLSPALVEQMVRDTLQATTDVAKLAELLYRKTLGNPFFLIHVIKTLAKDGLIAFDAHAARWTWDLAQIEAQGYSDNVADLMTRRLSQLSAESQHILQLAAAVGTRVDVRMLTMIAGEEEHHVRNVLAEAIAEGLLLAHGESYAFPHARMRQAAYGLLPVDDRPAVHVRIGRRLLAELSAEAVEAQVFDVVDQLNRGLALITDPAERLAIARLDLVAGKRAKSSGAFVAATSYLDAGLGLLPGDAWDSCYDLAFALRLHAAESRYLVGELAAADAQLSQLAERARTSGDVVSAIEVRADLLMSQGRLDEVIEVALVGLSRFGLPLPRYPTHEQVDNAYKVMWQLVGNRAIESLASLPPMRDAEKQAMFRLIMCAIPSAYIIDSNLHALLACHEVKLCLRNGNAEAAAFGYASLAICLVGRFRRYADAATFLTLTAELAERSQEMRAKLRAWFPLWGFAGFWIRPHRDCAEGLRRCFRLGVQLGDLTYACYAGMFLVAVRLSIGDPLDDVAREHREALEYARAMKFGIMAEVALVLRQLVASLRGETEAFADHRDAAFDDPEYERAVIGQPFTAAWYLVAKLQARFWAGDVAAAWQAAEALTPLRDSMIAMPIYAEYLYLRSLTVADRYGSMSAEEQTAGLATLREYQADIGVLAQLCPDNWRARHALVSAELARLTGDPLAAERAYEDAIRAAGDSGLCHQQALAYERAARFYRDRGFDLFANAYLHEAHTGYQRWGAQHKLRLLEARYPFLTGRARSAAGATTVSEALDAISIAKASRAISSTIVLADLHVVLLRLSMENAGARRAALLLSHDDGWTVEAELDVERGGRSFPPRPVAEVDTVPHSLITYVRRTREPVVLDDATRDPIFAGAFARGRLQSARSVLGVPIVRQDRLIGVLYLENDLVVGAFSAEKLAVIEQLAAQAAISLENARLYEDLRRENKEREQAQTALQANQALLEAIVENSPATIFVKDLAGRYILVNSLYAATLRERKEALLGKTDLELFPPEQADRYRANDEQVLASGQPLQADEVALTESGERTYLAIKFALRDDAGHAYAVCGIATDITERKRAEQALHDAIQLRDDFLRIASHELRTPLTPLQLQLELTRDMLRHRPEMSREVLAERLELSLRQLERLRSLVVEMLDVARLQSGRLELRLAQVDLCSVCRDVIAALELELARSGVQLRLDCSTPVVGQWDRARLEQIVTNLLTNALKFGARSQVEIVVRASEDYAILTVADHGIGIAPADQHRIFAPFERAVSTNYAGLGLGLYIAHEIAAAHGGNITVTSTLGLGATFTVTLPLEPRRAGSAGDQAGAARDAQKRSTISSR